MRADYLPTNLNPNDKELFTWVYTVVPEPLEPIVYTNVFYNNAELSDAQLNSIRHFFPQKQTRIKKAIKLLKSFLSGEMKVYLRKQVCIVSNPWSDNYFHWFAEVLPRILKTQELYKNVFFLFQFELNKQYQLPSVSQLHLKFETIRFKSFFARKMLYAMPMRQYTGHFRNCHFDQLRSLYLNKTNIKKKIYIRRNSPKRSVINSAEVNACFLKYGYELVQLENVGLDEQVQLFSGASVIASIHGAALTNMLFMKAGSIVLEMGLKGEKLDKCYFNMAKVLLHTYYYQSCSTPDVDKTYTEANLYVNIEDLNRLLNDISKNENL